MIILHLHVDTIMISLVYLTYIYMVVSSELLLLLDDDAFDSADGGDVNDGSGRSILSTKLYTGQPPTV